MTWLKLDWFKKPQQPQTVGFNPHQFPNLFWSAATQTPTLIQAGRRKLLPSSAVLAESENQAEDLLVFAGFLTKVSKAKLPLKNRLQAKFRISMRRKIALYKLPDELWVLSQMTISLDTDCATGDKIDFKGSSRCKRQTLDLTWNTGKSAKEE